MSLGHLCRDSSLGYRPPAPEAVQPWLPASATLQRATRAKHGRLHTESEAANRNV